MQEATPRYLTDGFKKERIVVEVILNEQNIPLALFPGALNQNIQCSLHGGAQISLSDNGGGGTNILVYVNQHDSSRVLELFQDIIVSPYHGPPTTTFAIQPTTGHALAARNAPKDFWCPCQLGPISRRWCGNYQNDVNKSI